MTSPSKRLEPFLLERVVECAHVAPPSQRSRRPPTTMGPPFCRRPRGAAASAFVVVAGASLVAAACGVRYAPEQGEDPTGVLARPHGCGAERTGNAPLRTLCAGLADDLKMAVLDFLRIRYQVAACLDCRSVTLWGLGGRRRDLHGHTAKISGLRFFPLGDRLLTWGEDGVAIIWDVASGSKLHELILEEEEENWEEDIGPVHSAQVFPNGDKVITCSWLGTCVIWDAETGVLLSALPVDYMRNAEVIPPGEHVVLWGLSETAYVANAATGDIVCELIGHTFGITVAAASLGGDTLVTGSLDASAIVWDLASCSKVAESKHRHRIVGAAFVGGGEQVVTVDGAGTVVVWSARTGERVSELQASAPRMEEIDYSSDPVVEAFQVFQNGGLAAAIVFGDVLVWNLSSGKLAGRLDTLDFIEDLGVSPAGDAMATCGSGRAVFWDGVGPAAARIDLDAPGRHGSPRPATFPQPCFVVVGLGAALDPGGLGRGISWREMAAQPRRTAGTTLKLPA